MLTSRLTKLRGFFGGILMGFVLALGVFFHRELYLLVPFLKDFGLVILGLGLCLLVDLGVFLAYVERQSLGLSLSYVLVHTILLWFALTQGSLVGSLVLLFLIVFQVVCVLYPRLVRKSGSSRQSVEETSSPWVLALGRWFSLYVFLRICNITILAGAMGSLWVLVLSLAIFLTQPWSWPHDLGKYLHARLKAWDILPWLVWVDRGLARLIIRWESPLVILLALFNLLKTWVFLGLVFLVFTGNLPQWVWWVFFATYVINYLSEAWVVLMGESPSSADLAAKLFQEAVDAYKKLPPEAKAKANGLMAGTVIGGAVKHHAETSGQDARDRVDKEVTEAYAHSSKDPSSGVLGKAWAAARLADAQKTQRDCAENSNTQLYVDSFKKDGGFSRSVHDAMADKIAKNPSLAAPGSIDREKEEALAKQILEEARAEVLKAEAAKRAAEEGQKGETSSSSPDPNELPSSL